MTEKMKKKNEIKIKNGFRKITGVGICASLGIPKEAHMPTPVIFLSPKILNPSPDEACLVF